MRKNGEVFYSSMSKLKYIIIATLLLFLLNGNLFANPFTVNKKHTFVTTSGSAFLPKSFVTKQGELKEKMAQAIEPALAGILMAAL